jgi:uncharacterized coiled-coil protein SlyX
LQDLADSFKQLLDPLDQILGMLKTNSTTQKLMASFQLLSMFLILGTAYYMIQIAIRLDKTEMQITEQAKTLNTLKVTIEATEKKVDKTDKTIKETAEKAETSSVQILPPAGSSKSDSAILLIKPKKSYPASSAASGIIEIPIQLPKGSRAGKF